MEIDLPEVIAEVRAEFERYEAALVSNDVAVLDLIFHNDRRSIRYGSGENLYGYGESSVPRGALAGRLGTHAVEDLITTYGRDLAVASTLFRRPAMNGKVGRQMQTWVRFPEGWRVVAAHVSVIDEPEMNNLLF